VSHEISGVVGLAVNSDRRECVTSEWEMWRDYQWTSICNIAICNRTARHHVTRMRESYRVFTRSGRRPALARVFWIHLLEVCWTFDGSCKRPHYIRERILISFTILVFWTHCAFWLSLRRLSLRLSVCHIRACNSKTIKKTFKQNQCKRFLCNGCATFQCKK